jgi:hypothetical protein
MDESAKFLKRKLFSKVISQNFKLPAEALNQGGWVGLREAIPKYLARIGAQPLFLKEKDENFGAMRHKLNTEAGLIICNHPSMAESPAILSTLERGDIMVVVGEHVYEASKDPLMVELHQHLVAARNPMMLRTVLRHINSGGLVLIYPSQNDQKNIEENGGKMRFKPGFKTILKGLRPEHMVYCFNINSQDAANFNKRHPKFGLGSELFVHPILNPNRIKDPQVVRMDEAYTQAEMWQQAIDASPAENPDQVLTDRYLSMFESNKS